MLEWGVERDMSPLDALMWRAEADPRLRSPVVALEILEARPDWKRLRAAHDWGSRMVPRFRQRVVDPGLGLPTWVVDGGFDLDNHLQRVLLPRPSWRLLLEAAQTLAMEPFASGRPPWEAVLFEGLPGGRAAYALKLHHAVTDGLGLAQLLGKLHSRTASPSPAKPQPPPPEPHAASAARELLRQGRADVEGVARWALGLRGSLGGLRHPDRTARDAAGFAASLRRVLADPPARPSPLLARRGLSRRFLALDCRLPDLRGAAKAHDCSLNDAYLAALLGAFRLYHESHGRPVDAMPVAIPISVRRKVDAGGGNRITAARLAGPVSIADPVDRMVEVRRLVREARAEPALGGLVAMAPAIARLPAPVIAKLAGATTTGTDLQASNVPGLREDVFLAGARIERVYPFAPLPGGAAMISLVSHGDLCCVGANLDGASFADLDGFAECLAAGFDEVLALHRGFEPATLRI